MKLRGTEDLSGIWPEETHQAAVSLTFDDGGPTQLSRAIPEMEKRGLRATFYLCPRGDDYAERLAPWKEIAARGHEIGNHTLSHTCSTNLKTYPPAGGLESMTLAEVEARRQGMVAANLSRREVYAGKKLTMEGGCC